MLWLLLNQTLSPGHLLLGGVVALVGGWALTAAAVAKARVRRPSCHPPTVGAGIWRTSSGPTSPWRASSWVSEGESERPGFVNIPLDLRDPYGLAALACIITSTPGTLVGQLRCTARAC